MEENKLLAVLPEDAPRDTITLTISNVFMKIEEKKKVCISINHTERLATSVILLLVPEATAEAIIEKLQETF